MLVGEYNVFKCVDLFVASASKSWNVPFKHSNERT